VIPHKSAACAIQKHVFGKKEGKYGAYRKRTTGNYYTFLLHSADINFTSLIHFTNRFKRVNKSDLEDAFRKEFTLQVRTKSTSSALLKEP